MAIKDGKWLEDFNNRCKELMLLQEGCNTGITPDTGKQNAFADAYQNDMRMVEELADKKSLAEDKLKDMF